MSRRINLNGFTLELGVRTMSSPRTGSLSLIRSIQNGIRICKTYHYLMMLILLVKKAFLRLSCHGSGLIQLIFVHGSPTYCLGGLSLRFGVCQQPLVASNDLGGQPPFGFLNVHAKSFPKWYDTCILDEN